MKTPLPTLSKQAMASLPEHIAIIMDGNGRWAKARNLPRVEGHRRGAESVRNIVRACGQLGIRYLTLYAFSSENWTRPESEVETLMGYLAHYLKHEERELMANDVRLETIGEIERLPEKVQKQLALTKKNLSSNNGVTLVLALSYGSRQEITRAVRLISTKVASGELNPDSIDERVVADHLYTAQIPDPDLMIRTSGEVRLSNFLLWQLSYAELVITRVHWPDFDAEELCQAIEEFALRHRRFGGL